MIDDPQPASRPPTYRFAEAPSRGNRTQARMSGELLRHGNEPCRSAIPPPLFQAVFDLVEAGSRAGFVELRAGRAAGADCAYHLVADLDHHPAAEEHYMRKLCQAIDAARLLGPLGERESVGAEGDAGVSLIVGAIERVDAGAVTTQL